MNWVKENTLFSAILGVILLATIALIVLLFLTMGRFNEVSGAYDRSAAEMNQLQSMRPHPNAGNLETLEEQKAQLAQAADNLRARLTSKVIQVEEISPNAFQDRLRSVVSEVISASAAANMTLPDGFYMGFSQYQDTLPSLEAAPYLNRQLTAINFMLQLLRDNRTSELTTLNRAPLPQELGTAEPANQPISRYSMEFSFVVEPGGLRTIINTLAGMDQLLVLRNLKVENERQEGPSRTETGTTMADAGGLDALFATGDEDTTPEAAPDSGERMQFVVGTEKLIVTATVDLLDFASEPVNPDATPSE